MSRYTFVLAACAAITFGAPGGTLAQTTDSVPAALSVKRLPRQKLSGPRFGFTTFTGDVADMRDAAGLETMMTQFGWQWETQIVSLTGGNQALMEWVLLLGGVEQDEFNLSPHHDEHGRGGRLDAPLRRPLRAGQPRGRDGQGWSAHHRADRLDHRVTASLVRPAGM